MWVTGSVRPPRNFCFQLLPVGHVKRHPQRFLDDRIPAGDSFLCSRS
jgi:hypothetical protein